jgi:hypothetical protein
MLFHYGLCGLCYYDFATVFHGKETGRVPRTKLKAKKIGVAQNADNTVKALMFQRTRKQPTWSEQGDLVEEEYIVSFRGMEDPNKLLTSSVPSKNKSQMLGGTKAVLVPYPLGGSGREGEEDTRVHLGMLEYYNDIRMQVNDVAFRFPQSKNTRIVFTGFSMGAPLAVLAALDFVNNFGPAAASRVFLYVFGSPRIGNSAFCSLCKEWFGPRYWSMYLMGDPVGEFPARDKGYVTSGQVIMMCEGEDRERPGENAQAYVYRWFDAPIISDHALAVISHTSVPTWKSWRYFNLRHRMTPFRAIFDDVLLTLRRTLQVEPLADDCYREVTLAPIILVEDKVKEETRHKLDKTATRSNKKGGGGGGPNLLRESSALSDYEDEQMDCTIDTQGVDELLSREILLDVKGEGK